MLCDSLSFPSLPFIISNQKVHKFIGTMFQVLIEFRKIYEAITPCRFHNLQYFKYFSLERWEQQSVAVSLALENICLQGTEDA
jgi:hypothetical protein